MASIFQVQSSSEDCDSNSDRRVLIVGTFLSSRRNTRSVCEDLADRLENAGWLVLRTSSAASRVFRLLEMLKTVLVFRNSYRVAIVDVFSGWAFVWAELVTTLLKRLKKPHVLILHGGNLPRFASRWSGRVLRVLEGASIVTTPSAFLCDRMKPYYPDITILPNFIDFKSCCWRFRKQVQPNLVWLRAFDYIYNPEMAVQVLNMLLAELPDATLLMVGQDKGDGSLASTKTVARKLCIEEKVRFVEGVPYSRVPEILNQGDIFINTTTADNTPISVILAMACGLPVVSTNVGGIPYLLEDECDALLVPNGDDRAMARAIIRLVGDSDLSKKIALNARNKAMSFDWEHILQRWEDLLLEVQNPGHSR